LPTAVLTTAAGADPAIKSPEPTITIAQILPFRMDQPSFV
jgi:hypothetical protein